MSVLPTSVKVAGFTFDIVSWEPRSASANGRFGEFSCTENVIRIDAGHNKYQVIDTLIHEIGHAIYWVYGLREGDDEERIVSTFGTAWTQVYRDNPDILNFIKGSLYETPAD